MDNKQDRVVRLRLNSASSGQPLLDHPLLNSVKGKAYKNSFAMVFYDTPSGHLYRRGNVWLLNRKNDDDWQQALVPVNSLFQSSRRPIEASVKKAKKSGSGKKGKKGTVAGPPRDDIEPLFSLNFTRVHRTLDLPGAGLIDFAEDIGTLTIGEQRSSFHELLLQGAPKDADRINQLALTLSFDLNGRLASGSSMARGYVLTLPSRRVLQFPSVESNPKKQSSEDIFIQHGHAMLDQLETMQRPVEMGQELSAGPAVMGLGQAIHQLRTLFILYAPFTPSGVGHQLEKALIDLEDRMALPYAWAWFHSHVFVDFVNRFHADRHLNTLRSRITEHRQTAVEDVCSVLSEMDFTRLVLGLRSWLSCRQWRETLDQDQIHQLTKPPVRWLGEVLKPLDAQLMDLGRQMGDRNSDPALFQRSLSVGHALSYGSSWMIDQPEKNSALNQLQQLTQQLKRLVNLLRAQDLIHTLSADHRCDTADLLTGWLASMENSAQQRLRRVWQRYERQTLWNGK
ncbi:MAG: hypothetical protein HQL54_01830 [Magnetococcales bacterium]|nr:hypothetical protein [Magnetococcales bacterium]